MIIRYYFVYNKEKFTPGIPHFGPEAHELIPELQVISEKFSINGYSFTPVPVLHAKNLKSLGYIVEKDEKRIFFTGDVAWIEKAQLERIGKVDLVVTEATMIKKGGRIHRSGNIIFGHTGIPDLIRILKPLTNRILFTHYGNWFFKDTENAPERIKEMATQDLEILTAYDGFELKV